MFCAAKLPSFATRNMGFPVGSSNLSEAAISGVQSRSLGAFRFIHPEGIASGGLPARRESPLNIAGLNYYSGGLPARRESPAGALRPEGIASGGSAPEGNASDGSPLGAVTFQKPRSAACSHAHWERSASFTRRELPAGAPRPEGIASGGSPPRRESPAGAPRPEGIASGGSAPEGNASDGSPLGAVTFQKPRSAACSHAHWERSASFTRREIPAGAPRRSISQRQE